MTGYVKPLQPQLRIGEYEVYKATYCGLCRELGRRYGAFARFFVSYDFTLYAMLSHGLAEDCVEFTEITCPANPFKRCKGATPSPHLELAAAASVIAAYYKIGDNLVDRGFKSRILSTVMLPFAHRGYRRAAQSYPWLDEAFRQLSTAQQGVELSGSTSPDEAAQPTAALLAELFLHLAPDGDEPTRRVLERLGYLTGRYIYLCDALDDLQDDLKKGNYNPFLYAAHSDMQPGDKLWDTLQPLRREAMGALYLTAAEAANAAALIELKCFAPIVDNIFTAGLKNTVDDIALRGGLRIG